jgi:type I restriction enzyme S subunit
MGITANIDISTEQRKILLDLFSKHLPKTKVWAFGSRVKWTTRFNSDLDLVVFSSSEQSNQVSTLKEALEESKLPFRVDLLVWDKLPENFQRNIEEGYVVLVGGDDVEMFGVMSSEWPLISIDEIKAESRSAISIGPFGSNMKSDCYVNEGIPVIRGTNIAEGPTFKGEFVYITEELADRLRSSNVYQYDLIFPHRGSIGEVGIILDNTRYVISSSLMKLTCDRSKVSPKFLYYFFKSSLGRHELLKNASQVGTPGIGQPLASLKSIEFRLPPLEIQNKIESILTSLDEKIELNRQTNQTLEQIAQALFKSWFVDFDPVKAKIAAKQAGANAEQIEQAALCAISGKTSEQLAQLNPQILQQLKTTAALFPDALVDSELGEIPEGWLVKSFGDLLLFSIGGDWGQDAPDEKHTEMVKILRGTDLPKIYNGSDDRVPVRFVDKKKLANRKLQAGDIVIEISGGSKEQPTGRSLFMTDEIINRLASPLEPASFCRLFRPLDIEVGLMLGLHLQKIYADGKTWLYQNQSTGISNFQTTVFLEKEFVVVPQEELKHYFYQTVMPLFKQLTSAENKHLTELRDALLPKLLSGELNLSNLDEGKLFNRDVATDRDLSLL